MIRRKEQAFVLVWVTIVVLVLTILGIGVLRLSAGESLLAVRDMQAMQAFELAEAGMNRALWQIGKTPTWTAGWTDQSLGAGTYTVTIEPAPDAGSGWSRIRSTGTVSGTSKTLSLTFMTRSWPVAFNYGLFWANPSQANSTLQLNNSVALVGDTFAYGNVQLASPASVTGGPLYATGTVSGQGRYTLGTLPDPLPDRVNLDTSAYDAFISTAAASPDLPSLTLSGTQTYDLNGQTLYVSGNIVLSNGARVNGPGRIVAGGNITLQTSSSMTGGIDLVAGGDIILQNNISYEGRGNIVYARTRIDMQNGSFSAEDLLYLTPGTLRMANSAALRGAVWAGTADLSNSANIIGAMYTNSFASNKITNSVRIQYSDSWRDLPPPGGIPTGNTGLTVGLWEEP